MTSVTLHDQLTTFEQRRLRLLSRAVRVFAVGAAMLVLGAALWPLRFLELPVPYLDIHFNIKYLIAVCLAGGITVIALLEPARAYRIDFKLEVVEALAASVHPSFVFSPTATLTCAEFNAMGLFSEQANRFSAEDSIQGKVGATTINACEVAAIRRTKNSKNEEHDETVFEGLLCSVDFNKNFSGYTLVAPDNTEVFFGRFAQTLQSLNFTQRGALVRLEDPEFEKLFCVYSTDQLEARYLLSTSLMGRLVALRKKLGRELRLAFHHNQLLVAIPHEKHSFLVPFASGTPLFEPRWLRKNTDPGLLEEIEQELRFLVDVVEELDLNTRIWTKA